MIDHGKRRSLKFITAVGAAAVSGTGPAFATYPNNSAIVTGTSNSPSNRPSNHLGMQVITGRSALADTVIFTNNSGKDIRLTEFLPGHLTNDNQMLDLNSLLDDGEILIKSGYPVASQAASWTPLSLESSQSYLWCDTAVSSLHPGDSPNNTGVINITVAVLDGRALLTAEHEGIIFS